MVNAEVDDEELSKQANADKNESKAETWTKSRGSYLVYTSFSKKSCIYNGIIMVRCKS